MMKHARKTCQDLIAIEAAAGFDFQQGTLVKL